MTILYLLIPISILILGVAIWAFVWAIKSGQFDDLEGPAHRILMDDDDPRIPTRSGAARNSGDRNKDKAAAAPRDEPEDEVHKKIL